MRNLSVVILTHNSEASIERTLRAALQVTDDIHVVDSFSSDRTLAVCQQFGCHIVQRPFETYALQRNWAIENLPLRHDWQLHLDADEELTPDFIVALRAKMSSNDEFDGLIVGRKLVVFGRVLRFGGIAKTWHCRIFRTGFGRCEDRLYDQHFVCAGTVALLRSFMLDHQEASLSSWTAAHNRWSDLEAAEVGASGPVTGQRVAARAGGNVIERRRFYKSKYYAAPAFARALAYFLFRYVVLLGFLDGRPGLIYHVLQGFWFRFLVDAKIYEGARRAALQDAAPCRSEIAS